MASANSSENGKIGGSYPQVIERDRIVCQKLAIEVPFNHVMGNPIKSNTPTSKEHRVL